MYLNFCLEDILSSGVAVSYGCRLLVSGPDVLLPLFRVRSLIEGRKARLLCSGKPRGMY